jgi:hypothetical protein
VKGNFQMCTKVSFNRASRKGMTPDKTQAQYIPVAYGFRIIARGAPSIIHLPSTTHTAHTKYRAGPSQFASELAGSGRFPCLPNFPRDQPVKLSVTIDQPALSAPWYQQQIVQGQTCSEWPATAVPQEGQNRRWVFYSIATKGLPLYG